MQQSHSTSPLSAAASGSDSNSNCRRRGLSAVTAEGTGKARAVSVMSPAAAAEGCDGVFWSCPGKRDGDAGCQEHCWGRAWAQVAPAAPGTQQPLEKLHLGNTHSCHGLLHRKVNQFHITDRFSIAKQKELPSQSRAQPAHVAGLRASAEAQVTLWQPG